MGGTSANKKNKPTLQNVLENGSAASISGGSSVIIDSGALVYRLLDGSNVNGIAISSSATVVTAAKIGVGAISFIVSATIGARITDTAFQRGVVYSSDYSSNFTDRSLVDKAFTEKSSALSKGNLIRNVITAPVLTATTNDWSPADLTDDTDLIRVDIDVNNRRINGLVAPPAGVNRIIGIKNTNTGSFRISFRHDAAGSVAANRFLCGDNANKSIKPNEIAFWFYDHIVQRWTPFNRIG